MAPERVNLSRRLQYPGLAAIIVLYLAHVRLLDGRLQDDAFISFRYARNLAEGAGLVYNPGERVEGITNLLWTLILSIPFFLSKAADPVVVARGLSIASGVVTLVATFWLVRRAAPKSPLLPLVAAVLLAGSWPFAINTMTGLETVFFGALLTTGTLLLVIEDEDLRYRGSSVLFALAALTRPEAVGLFTLLFVAVALGQRGRGPGVRPYLLRLGLPFAGALAAVEAFRLVHYGALVPNTYHAKAGASLPPGLPTPGGYVGAFIAKGMPRFYVFSALPVVFLVANLGARWARPIALCVLFAFLNVAVSGADFMIGYRYFVPYLPLIYVAAALGGALVVERRRLWGKGSVPVAKEGQEAPRPYAFELQALLLVLALFVSMRGYAHSRDDLRPFEQLRRRIAADTNEALGRWMGAHLPAGTVLATVDIGEIGYWSRLPVVDLSGLTDRTIARRPGNLLDRELDLDELFARGIGGFVFTTQRPGPPDGPGQLAAYWPPGSSRAILTDARLKEGFSFVSRYPSYVRLAPGPDGSWQPVEGLSRSTGDRDNTHFLELYLRKDIADGLSLDQRRQ
jgi:arabinofuranosyltransferase